MKDKHWIIVAVIMAIAILGFGVLNYVTKMKTLEHVKTEGRAKELRMIMLYDNCAKEVYELYISDWENECLRLYDKNECALPLYLSDRLDEGRTTGEANCVKLFGN